LKNISANSTLPSPSQPDHPLPKVAVIILNWNQKEMTLACLDSLFQISYPAFEVFLVDNASADDSVEAIGKAFPQVILLRNRENLGVAGGRNRGLKQVLRGDADYLLLLDNDTIVDRDFLSEMVLVGQRDPTVGILTGKILFHSAPDTIWCAGGTLNLYRCDFRLIGHGEVDRGQYNDVREVDHVTGCCFMIKRSVIEDIGLLDENFAQYFGEDTDWCLRARNKQYKVVYTPDARLWHHVVKKTSVDERYLYLKGRNLFLFMRKHARTRHWIVFIFFFFIRSLKVLYRETRAGNFKHFVTMARGALNALRIEK